MDVNSPDELKFIGQIMQRWCLPTTPDVRTLLSSYVLFGSKSRNNLTQHYLQQVKRFTPWMLGEPDTLMNGYLYYVSNLMFAMCHYSTLETLHGDQMWDIVDMRVMKISLVCVTADAMLDKTTSTERKDIGQQIASVLMALKTKTSCSSAMHPQIRAAALLLQDLIRDVPTALPVVIATFAAELASGKQQDTKPSYTELLQIEACKGALTFELVGAIINNGASLHVPPELGYVIQLYDDLADMYIDQAEGTWTLVADRIANEGTVDRLFFEMACAIDKLPIIYWPFKIFCTLCMGAIAATNPYVSPTLTALLQPYSLMHNRGKDHEDIPLYREAIYRHLAYNIQCMVN